MINIFAEQLYYEMCKNNDIYLLHINSEDIFPKSITFFKDRCVNFKNSKNCIISFACGISRGGKIPIIYLSSPSLIFKSCEIIRSFVNYNNIPIIIAYSGRGQELKEYGNPHWSNDIDSFLSLFESIKKVSVDSVNDIDKILNDAISEKCSKIIELAIN